MKPVVSPILVVDDHTTSRYAKARTLQHAGFEVIEADNGTRALELLRVHRPRLVVLDVNLPDIDGFELCRRIKADPETASTVVLQVSATYVHQSDMVRALETGADASLVEPIDATVLVATVRALLRARTAEDALRDALASAEAANRVKDEFLATLSHELRTPLGAILTWVTLLRGEPVDSEHLTRGLAAIERNTRLQAKLVEDLLDISRIISGKMQLDVGRVDLKGIVGAAVEAIAPAAAAKDVRLAADFATDLPAIDGDAGRLQQIVSNLLSNAVKFTPPLGRADIRVWQTDGWVQIQVHDTGKGIEPQFLPHVFERFLQADSSTTRTEAGLGLGLAIVRHLAQAHGGSAEAASEGVGRGATFTVRLPVPKGATAGVLPRTAALHPRVSPGPSPRRELTGVRVLVVEDDSDSRDAILAALTSAGATLVSASNVREALERFAEGPVDVLVSDIGMPGAGRLRADAASPRARGGGDARTARRGRAHRLRERRKTSAVPSPEATMPSLRSPQMRESWSPRWPGSRDSGSQPMDAQRTPSPADYIATAELDRRRRREPDHAAENRALVALAERMATSPKDALEHLVQVALELCCAQSAGISLAEEQRRRPVFRWRAAAGRFAPLVGTGVPREVSPSALVLERGEPTLFRVPRQAPLDPAPPALEEALLVPLQVPGGPSGTLWVIAHDETCRFDREDARLLASLARFAALGLRTLSLLGDETSARRDAQQAVAALRESEQRFGKFMQRLPGPGLDQGPRRPLRVRERRRRAGVPAAARRALGPDRRRDLPARRRRAVPRERRGGAGQRRHRDHRDARAGRRRPPLDRQQVPDPGRRRRAEPDRRRGDRHHRAHPGRGGDPRERGALPRDGRQHAGDHLHHPARRLLHVPLQRVDPLTGRSIEAGSASARATPCTPTTSSQARRCSHRPRPRSASSSGSRRRPAGTTG